MKSVSIALVSLILSAASALAQSDKSPLDLPIDTIAATAGGKAVLEKDFPGLCAHPMYSSFKRMSLNQIAALSKGEITPAMLTQAQTDLAALPQTAEAQIATPINVTPISANP